MATDFDGRVDIVPVSDPNIISSTQRIAQAQAVMDLAEKHSDKVDLKKAIINMLKVMRVQDADSFMINEPDPMAQQIQQLEIEKLKAEIAYIKSQMTVKNVEGMFSAISAAKEVAILPQIAPISDSIYKSAGGEDMNGYPLAQAPEQAMPIQPAQQNTSPNFPPNPEVGMMQGIEGGQ